MNDTENELLTSNYKAAVKIKQLQEQLAAKDADYFLIRDHNKKLCDEIDSKNKRIAKIDEVMLAQWGNLNKQGGEIESLKEQLKESKEVIQNGVYLILTESRTIWSEKAKEFLQKLGEK